MAVADGPLHAHHRGCHQRYAGHDQHQADKLVAVEQRDDARLSTDWRRVDVCERGPVRGHQRLLLVGQGRQRRGSHPLVGARPGQVQALVESGVLPGTIGKMIKKKKPETQPGFPILGYTPSGEPVYETGVPGGPSEPFTWALDVPEPEMPPSTEDEQAADVAPDTAVEAPPMSVGSAMSGFGGDQITLGDLEPAHYELITATSNGVMFAWEAPLVLVKESARTDIRYLRAATKRWMREQGK